MLPKLNVENNVQLFENERSDIEKKIADILKEIKNVRTEVKSFNQRREGFAFRLVEERNLGLCDECKTFVPKKDILPITWKSTRSGGGVYEGRWTEEVTETANICQECFQVKARQREVRILPESELKFDSQKILANIDKMEIGAIFPVEIKYPEFK